jgi:hypothetical protein
MSCWDELIQKCPRLYKNGIIFECGRGWFDIVRDLSIKIERILEQNAERYQVPEGEEDCEIKMFAVQVKEKYGTLRFYMCCETKEIEELIGEAEALSTQTCENCGAPAKMRGMHWFEVKCDDCYKENK